MRISETVEKPRPALFFQVAVEDFPGKRNSRLQEIFFLKQRMGIYEFGEEDFHAVY
jgi:hypothetical protein